MKKLEMSLPPATSSSSECEISPERLQYAAERARLLFGCYRKGDANDPETYTAAVTAILADYSPEVIRRVTDPRTGIPRKLKFMPNPAEVAEECEAAMAAIRAENIIFMQGWRWEGDRWQKRA